MRLAEALAERKALDARLSSIEGRLRANARIQEGDAVSEDPERLFALLDSTAEELRTLMVRIARRSADDVRVVPVIDVVARKHEADALAARIRGIDARIQAANWA